VQLKQNIFLPREALATRPKGPGRRIPPELRRLIGRYAQRRIAEGASRVQIVSEVGVGDGAIVRALEGERAEALRPVRVVSQSTSAPEVTVRGPAGLTIEGLDVEGLVALIRALS